MQRDARVAARVTELLLRASEIEDAATIEATKRLAITKERVLAELAAIGFANMGDYMRIGADGDPYLSFAARVTFDVVPPFACNDDSELCPGPAVECPTSAAAASRALTLGLRQAGAIAFSRTGDPNRGEWSNAVIFAEVGETAM